ncbi:hypothetical protein [Thalassomonas actiniarum]|uniref:Uncharacterized protein n=1 Tax=Thalassomonas actiniarum TaxID=485447 RepID=A0AAF0C329_9GAMM|nr:hypothetical protein [Thalassomonas actiniarum]WDD98543.1 hypothetical protein SG35_025360 [Thalassomonas actiniarum]
MRRNYFNFFAALCLQYHFINGAQSNRYQDFPISRNSKNLTLAASLRLTHSQHACPCAQGFPQSRPDIKYLQDSFVLYQHPFSLQKPVFLTGSPDIPIGKTRILQSKFQPLSSANGAIFTPLLIYFKATANGI